MPAAGGPIAAIADGDLVTIDVENRRLDVILMPDEIADRPAELQPRAPACTRGVLAKYAGLVSDASRDAVTDAWSREESRLRVVPPFRP